MQEEKKKEVIMRRDSVRDLEFAYQVIDSSEYGMLCVFDYNLHALPFSAVREGNKLYFASAKKGTKVDIFEHEDMIKVVFVSKANVANTYSEEEIQREGEAKNGDFFSENVFTNEYESAIADGMVSLVEDEEQCARALKLLYEKYYHKHIQYFDLVREKTLEHANIYQILMTNITAKERKVEK